jgi:ribosomal protein L40E
MARAFSRCRYKKLRLASVELAARRRPAHFSSRLRQNHRQRRLASPTHSQQNEIGLVPVVRGYAVVAFKCVFDSLDASIVAIRQDTTSAGSIRRCDHAERLYLKKAARDIEHGSVQGNPLESACFVRSIHFDRCSLRPVCF